jgi:hypothetical protein
LEKWIDPNINKPTTIVTKTTEQLRECIGYIGKFNTETTFRNNVLDVIQADLEVFSKMYFEYDRKRKGGKNYYVISIHRE